MGGILILQVIIIPPVWMKCIVGVFKVKKYRPIFVLEYRRDYNRLDVFIFTQISLAIPYKGHRHLK
jgi:hypothetical protein